MKRLAIVLFALVVWACPGMLHASLWHKAQPKVTRHHTVGHPYTRHYTQRAQRHQVVRPQHVRRYTRKAHANKAARHLHKAHKHKKVGHR